MNSETNESKVIGADSFKRGRRRPSELPAAPERSEDTLPVASLGVDYAEIPFTNVFSGKYKNVLGAQVAAGAVGTDPERAQEFVERLLLAEKNLRDEIEGGEQVPSRVLAAHREIWQCLERGI